MSIETERDLVEAFETMLDEVYEPYVMGDLTFYPVQILKGDPIAYRCALLDYADSIGVDTDTLTP